MVKMIISEIRRLDHVIVHTPGECSERITPNMIDSSNKQYVLVDDIICVPIAQDEHRTFLDVLSTVADVVHFSDLLTEVLTEDPSRKELVLNELSSFEELTADRKKILLEMTPEKLTTVLISGHDDEIKFFEPSPNLVFTRDIGAVVGKLFINCSAASFEGLENKSPRNKEMILMRFITNHHPIFRKYRIIDINKNREDRVSVEGGDFTIVNKEVLLVGISERTTDEAVNLLAPYIFEEGFKYIIKVSLPRNHGSMHLDTVFSLISENECVIFKDLVCQKMDFDILSVDGKISVKNKNLLELLKDIGINLKYYLCGGENSIVAKREQWTDGANMLTIAPSVVVSYDRNIETCSSMEEGGYITISANTFCDNSEFYLSNGKVIIQIPSGELSRGRGGPRCMSMPIQRT